MINDIKELRALLTLCRAKGVAEITIAGTVIKFGDLPRKGSREADEDAEDSDEVPTDGLTPEQLMFFSAPPGEGNP